MRSKFEEGSCYFIPGEYEFDDSLRFIYLKDGKTYQKSSQLFGQPLMHPVKKIFVYVVKRIFFNKSMMINEIPAVPEFQGTAFFIGTDKVSSGKAFDFDNNKVVTLYFSEKEFFLHLDNYHYFKSYFNSPQMIMQNPNKLMIMEELIRYKYSADWSAEEFDFVMSRIFEHYIQYFIVCQRKGEFTFKGASALISQLDPKDEGRILLEKMTNDQLLKEKFPFLKMHGDLWAPNILLNRENNGELYFIDFEYSDEYMFLYDIFWFIQTQFLNYNNEYFLKKYILGAYDSYFQSMFSIFGLSFHKEYRKEYLTIYFANVYIKRWRKLSKKNRKIQVSKLRDIINIQSNRDTLKQLG